MLTGLSLVAHQRTTKKLPVFTVPVDSGSYQPGNLVLLPGAFYTNLPVAFELVDSLSVPRRIIAVLEFGTGLTASSWAAWLSFPLYGVRGVAVMTAYQELKGAIYFPERNRDLSGLSWVVTKQY